MENVKKQKYTQDIIMLFGMVLVLVLSFWKSKYGLGGGDEAFDLTIAYRMCHGDKLFLHEWHVSQLSSFLLFPIMKLYLLLFNSTDAIILHFRYIYIFVNLLVGCVAYFRLRKHGIGAVFAVVLYLLYVPYNIMNLSYDNMGLMCNFLCTIFLITSDEKYKIYLIAGIFYAGMVLCQPPLIFVFAVVFFVGLIFILVRRQYKTLRKLGAFLAGCVIPAIPVLAYLLINVGIKNIVISLVGMMSDPEHSATTNVLVIIYKTLLTYFPKATLSIGNVIALSVRKLLLISFAGFILVWLALIFDKHRKKRQALYLIFSGLCVICVGAAYLVCVRDSYINFLLFAWALHGITFFVFEDKPERKVLLISYFIGLSHLIAFLGSNQYGHVFGIALLPTCLIVIMLSIKQIEIRYKGCRNEIAVSQKVQDVFICLCVVISLVFLVYARCVHVFRQTSPCTLSVCCDSGPQKGILVSENTYENFETYLNDINDKDISQNDNVLLLTEQTWTYLCLDAPLAQYSAWLSGVNDKTYERLQFYYEINPDKVPNKIFIEKESVEENTVKLWADENDFQLHVGGALYFLEQN